MALIGRCWVKARGSSNRSGMLIHEWQRPIDEGFMSFHEPAPRGGESLVILALSNTTPGKEGETANEQALAMVGGPLAVEHLWGRSSLWVRWGSTRGGYRHRTKTHGIVPKRSDDDLYGVG